MSKTFKTRTVQFYYKISIAYQILIFPIQQQRHYSPRSCYSEGTPLWEDKWDVCSLKNEEINDNEGNG